MTKAFLAFAGSDDLGQALHNAVETPHRPFR